MQQKEMNTSSDEKSIISVYNDISEHFDNSILSKENIWCKGRESSAGYEKIEDCYCCKSNIYNYIETELARLRIGDTRCVRIRKEKMKERLMEYCTISDFSFLDKFAYDFNASKTPLTNQSNGNNSVGVSGGGGGGGIRYWVDKYLGTNKNNFSILGPNVDYGPISLILNKDVMKLAGSDMLINSSTTFISGHSFQLRPWAGMYICQLEKNGCEKDMFGNSWGSSPLSIAMQYFSAYNKPGSSIIGYEMAARKKLYMNSKLNALESTWSHIFATEIAAQARCAYSENLFHIELYASKEYHHPPSPLPGLIASSFVPSQKKRPNQVTTDDIIDWYYKVDSHGRIEVLLPSFVPIKYIEYILIPENLYGEDLQMAIYDAFPNHCPKVITVKSEEESQNWQEVFFKTGKEPTMQNYSSSDSTTLTIDSKHTTHSSSLVPTNSLYQDIFISHDELELHKDNQKHVVLGSGAFGTVYKGKWQGIDVAIKKLHYEALPSEVYKEFIKEAKILSRIRHPNIVLFYGISSMNGMIGGQLPQSTQNLMELGSNLMMVMEFMSKGSLFQFLNSSGAKEQISWRQRWQIAHHIAMGINHLHKKKILHRDLKSLNVLLNDQYHCKIADFGLSKSGILTNTHVSSFQVGTPQWTAPEVFNGEKFSEKSDIYSFGIILWEIATCKPPFQNLKLPIQIAFHVVDGKRESIPDNTPVSFSNLIKMCWSDSPESRPDAPTIIKLLMDMKVEVENTK